jgi:hypothetical protein
MQMRLFLMESPFLVSLAIADGPWQWIETFENGLPRETSTRLHLSGRRASVFASTNPAFSVINIVDSFHPESPDEKLLVFNSEARIFSSWQ